MPGVIRTRVGYAGGIKPDPTYRSLGNHSETIQIDYDPAIVSYEELLEVYWESHSPTSRPFSRQYASIIFFHDKDQEKLAKESKSQEAAKRETQLYTEILPASEFYLAEDYHQKYWLQQAPILMEAFRSIYPDPSDFVNSTAAARLNGFVGGNATLPELVSALEKTELSSEARERLLEIAARVRQ